MTSLENLEPADSFSIMAKRLIPSLHLFPEAQLSGYRTSETGVLITLFFVQETLVRINDRN